MFCRQCGAELAPNAHFCSNCGTQVTIEDTETEMQGSTQTMPSDNAASDNEAKTADTASSAPAEPRMFRVKFWGRILEFDPAIIEYAKLKKRFYEHARTAEKDFLSRYQECVKDFNSLYDEGVTYFLQTINEALEFGISVAHEYGGSLNKEHLLERTEGGDTFNNAMDYYVDIAEQLTEVAGQVKNYRDQQHSASQVQWQGGGFGVTGAIKGAMAASILQLGTDALREMGRSALSYADRSRLKKLEEEIYKKADHKSKLVAALLSWYNSEWKTVVSLLVEQNILREPPLDSVAGMEPIVQANDIVGRTSPDMPPSEYEKAIDLICQGLPYDPFGPWAINAYCLLYKIPSTNKRMVLNLAKFFGVEQEYLEAKRNIESEILTPVLGMSEDSINEINEKIAAVQRLTAVYSDITASAIIDPLKSKRNRMQRQQDEESAKKAAEEEINRGKIIEIQTLPENTLEEVEMKLKKICTCHFVPGSALDDEYHRLWVIRNNMDWHARCPQTMDNEIMQITHSRNVVSPLIDAEKIGVVWDLAKSGDVYAEFRLRAWYEQTCEAAIKAQNVISYEESMRVLRKYSAKELSFATALCLRLDYLMYYFYSPNPSANYACDCAKKMLVLAETGNATAMYHIGDWGLQEHYGLTETQGRKYMSLAAKKHYPSAFLDLGKNHELGQHGYKWSIPLAYYYYKLYNANFDKPDLEMLDHLLTTTYLWSEQYDAYEKNASPTVQSSSSACFITSAVCRTFNKHDDCYELTAFRSFRDNWLAKQPGGQAIIQEYYRIAPAIVEHINQRNDSKEVYQSIWDTYLIPCLHYIEAQQFTECKDTYAEMVNDLKQKYLEGK